MFATPWAWDTDASAHPQQRGRALSTTEHDQIAPQQQEMPFAVVRGEPVTALPRDLYIPPEALEVFLEAFEGPLDLLLYLIKRQNLEILDIPIAEVTRQYVQYVELMKDMQLELAGEYLVMAAMLAEIKSRMLLPRPASEDEDERDPRAELVRRLQEYERFKQAAEDIESLPRIGRDTFAVSAEVVDKKVVRLPPRVEMRDVLAAFKDVMHRVEMFAHHHVKLEPLSVRERMADVLQSVKAENFSEFQSLFDVKEGRSGVVVTLLALLELLKQALVELVQNEPYGQIYVRAVSASQQQAEVQDE
ncbi:MAG: segregation/condensation protein A [Pseudomonadota bacterium]|nr:MAG: segregation/condensation protein A [Pseudomonadota bacterium]